jgi:toxin ParE1/3/4
MTERRLLLRPLAEADIEEVLRTCRADGGPAFARRFAEDLEGALSTLAAHPAIGSPRYADLLQVPGLRSWPIGKSAYLIF